MSFLTRPSLRSSRSNERATSLAWGLGVVLFATICGGLGACSAFSSDESPAPEAPTDGVDAGTTGGDASGGLVEPPGTEDPKDAGKDADLDACSCKAPQHGKASCAGGGCEITCDKDYEVVGDACLPVIPDWTVQFGSTGQDMISDLAVDPAGNTFVVGYTDAVLPGQTTLGNEDVFIAKFDESGARLWLRQLGTAGADRALGIAVDGGGNAYVVGQVPSALPGQAAIGGKDLFAVKYDSGGKQVWARQLGTTEGDTAYGVAVDASGALFITGTTEGEFPGQEALGGRDAFVMRLDPSGNVAWTRQFGSNTNDDGNSVALDPSGNIVVAATTIGPAPQVLSNGLVTKFDPFGNALWTRTFDVGRGGTAAAVVVTVGGDVLVAGMTHVALPGQTLGGASDGYVIRFDGAGSARWTRQVGTKDLEWAPDLVVDAEDHTLVVGATNGAFSGQTKPADLDVFLVDLDPTGKVVSASQFGTSDADDVMAIARGTRGKLMIGGITYGAFPGTTNAGPFDVFVRRMTP